MNAIEVDEQAVTNAKAAKKKSKQAAIPGKSAALAKIETPVLEGELVEAEALDTVISRISTLKANLWANAYDIGVEFGKIHKEQLWKQRLRPDNKQQYRSFEDCVETEIGISKPYAVKLLKIAACFSREEVVKFGTTKLALVLEAPPELQQRLLEKVGAGAPRQEIATEVREANAQVAASIARGEKPNVDPKKAGNLGNKNRAAKPTRVTATPAAPTKRGDTVTIASIEGKKRIDLFKRQADGAPTLARTIEDEPWGSIDLENNVRISVAIAKGRDGTLKLVMITERIAS